MILDRSTNNQTLINKKVAQYRNLKQEDVDHFSPVLPVVVNLRNQGLQERHWGQIHELIGFEIKGRPEITLGELIDKKVVIYVSCCGICLLQLYPTSC